MYTIDDFMIGTYASGPDDMTSLRVLMPDAGKIIEPDFAYKDYAAIRPLGNGQVRGVGLPICSWYWSHLTASQREALRTIIPGAAAEVYIRIYVNDTLYDERVWSTYLANAIWPDKEETKESGNQILDFTLNFRDLVWVD